MNISKVKIKNFKKISDTVEFNLNNGLHLIMSSTNGVGKTTLLNAIVFGLFNKSGDTKGSSKSTIPTSRLINDAFNKDMLVEIYFDTGLIIKRGLKPDIFEIIKDGENLANTSSKTIDQDFLENDILAMDYNSFMSTIFLNSKPNSVPFIYMTAGQRKEYVEKILDLRILFHMNESLKKKTSLKKMEEGDTQKELEWSKTQQTVLENELERAKLQKIEAEKQIEIFYKQKEGNIQQLQSEISEKEENIIALEQNEIFMGIVPNDIQQRVNKIQQEILDLKLKKENTLGENSNIHDKKLLELELLTATIELKISEQENKVKQLEQNVIILNAQILGYNELELKAEKLNIEKKLDELKQVALQKTAEKDAFLKNKENYTMCGECPTLSKIIGSFPENEFNIFITELKENVFKLREKLNSIVIKLIEVNNLKEELLTKQNILTSEQYKLTEIKNKLISVNKDKDNISILISEAANNIKKEKDSIQLLIESKESSIITTLNEINSRKENFLEKINFIKIEIQKTKENISRIRIQEAPKVSEINEQPLIDIKDKITALSLLSDKISGELMELTFIKDHINAKDIKEAALQTYIPIFEDKVNTLLDRFMAEDPFTIKANLSDTFEITFTKNGREIDMFSLSEGQKSSITFAFTFSFQHLLDIKNAIGMNLLLIDEILDIALSSGRLNTIMEYLKEISLNKSVYVVSHNSNLQLELFDSITEVTLKNGFSNYEIS